MEQKRIKVRLTKNSPYSDYGYYEKGDIGYIDGYVNDNAVIILENGKFAKAELTWIEVVNDEDKNVNTELKESEDERIRKTLVAVVNLYYGEGEDEEKTACLSWLEKQGEQKPADKVEPKFKIGDFIVNDYCMGRIVEITNNAYLLDTEQGIPFSCHSTRLWDVTKDAKDGDVLSNGKMIVIFKYFEEPSYRQHIVAYIGLDAYGDIQITNETWTLGIDKAKPATKEQRDQLEKAMADAGYRWNKEELRLEKILKDRIQPQPKQEWSEQEQVRINRIVSCLENLNVADNDILLKDVEWLKSLRPQKKEALPQWRRLPLNGVSYAPDYWCVMDVITSTVGANSASVSALVKGDYYVPLFELEKFIRNI